MKKKFKYISLVAIAIFFSALLTNAQVWTAPTQTPPGGNTYPPINEGSAAQIKAGGLWIATGAVTNGLIVQNGNVGIGSVAPTQRLDVAGSIKASTGFCIGGSCISSWPSGGAGTVTGVTAGTGLTGGTITTSGTVAADTAYLQRRVSATCAVGSSIRVVNSDGTVTCQTDNVGAGGITGSGSLNYIPKWTPTGTSLGNSLISDNGSTVNLAGNLSFSAANPTISASSYFVAPGGAYFNGGTVYMEAPLQARGGVHSDTTTNLNIAGGLSGNTNFSGSILVPTICLSGDCKSAWPVSGVGTITGVTAGTGLSGGGTSGTVTLNNTGVTSVSAGSGISLSGTTGNVTISATGGGSVTGSGSTNYLPKWTGATSLANSIVSDNGATASVNGSIDVSSANSSFGNTNTRIFLRDSDESTGGAKSIHANSNVAGFLNGSDSWMSYWDTNGNMQNTGQINVGNYVLVNSKYAIDGTDGWLRLNQQNSFAGGVYTPYNLRVDGGYYGGGTINLRESTVVSGDLTTNTLRLSGNPSAYLTEGWGIRVGGDATHPLQVPSASILVGASAAGGNYGTGNVYANAFYYNSDRTLKQNIKPISGQMSLEKILKLEGVSFNWKKDNSPSVGLIAQDVEKVYPELVHTDGAGLKSVEYGNLVAPLIEAIRAQQKQIDELRVEIEGLKSVK